MGKKPVNKQADRRAAKKAEAEAANVAEERPAPEHGSIVDLAKALVLGSVAVEYGPKMHPMVMEAVEEVKTGKKKETKKPKEEPAKKATDDEDEKKDEADHDADHAAGEENDKDNGNGKAENGNGKTENGGHEDGSPEAMFASLGLRLAWHNCLGLSAPFSGEAAMKAWKDMLALEIDFGPRAKRKGNPGLDRVLANATKQMPQYIHFLLAIMTLRAFVFRSYFACLPWLLLYQFASLKIPLDVLPQVPALPLDKIDIKFRVAATVALNALVWLFFAYEAVWKVWWLEKPLWLIPICVHAYIARPADQ